MKKNVPAPKGLDWVKSELGKRIRNSVPGRLFGFELESIGKGRAVMTMRVRKRHIQVHGVVHGGILASLADTVGALAAYPMLPRGTRLATVEMKINYLEPVIHGSVSGEGRILRLGRSLAVAECKVTDSRGDLAAVALITYAITLPREKSRRA